MDLSTNRLYLLEQRERLKELCKQNVMSHRDTEAYVAALTGVRDDIQELQRQRKVVEDEKAKKAAENNNANDEGVDSSGLPVDPEPVMAVIPNTNLNGTIL